jgi:hypothetical protein
LSIKSLLEKIVNEQLAFVIGNISVTNYVSKEIQDVIKRKKELVKARKAEIVKCEAQVTIVRELTFGNRKEVDYVVHFQYLVDQIGLLYVEEERVERRIVIEKEKVVSDTYIEYANEDEPTEFLERDVTKGKGQYIPYKYNRIEAVKYAEAWWNGRNPAYKNFPDNCTNFVSQCLRAGQAPMTGYPTVRKGWWQQNRQWSWSWAVAHSFHWYLSGAAVGLRAQQVEKPEELLLGDVIAYDFENDGRWNHTTIVVAKDAKGMPLVNAHSSDSRKRYWTYEDSNKYTPQMKYKFFHIVDNE